MSFYKFMQISNSLSKAINNKSKWLQSWPTRWWLFSQKICSRIAVPTPVFKGKNSIKSLNAAALCQATAFPPAPKWRRVTTNKLQFWSFGTLPKVPNIYHYYNSSECVFIFYRFKTQATTNEYISYHSIRWSGHKSPLMGFSVTHKKMEKAFTNFTGKGKRQGSDIKIFTFVLVVLM